MRIEAALVEFLKSDPTVRALTADGKYLYRGKALPDAAWPRLHYWLATGSDYYLLDGKAAGQPTETFRLECLGRGVSGYEDAKALSDAVQEARGGVPGGQRLKEFVAGWFPPRSATPLWVQAVRVQERQAGEETQPAAGGSKSIFVVALDVVISYVLPGYGEG
jgi:hypothetical protein